MVVVQALARELKRALAAANELRKKSRAVAVAKRQS